jgi:two-component system, LytTR family, sensor histidine kinase LytS
MTFVTLDCVQGGVIMSGDLLLELVSDMSFIAMVAYLIGRSKYMIGCIQSPENWQNRVSLFSIFSLVSIMGTYNGIPVEGALANTRIVGVLISGFMGGPVVGLGVGIISGFHRYMLGGFTAETCGIAAVLAGAMAGLVRQKLGLHRLTWKTGILVALSAEIIQKGMVILFAKPFSAAVALERAIALPTTSVTVLGTVIFMIIVQDIKSTQEMHGARAAELSLEIASRTLPYLRQGLYIDSAQRTAEIIYELTKMDSVSITDREKVLGFVGKGDDHHKIGEPLQTESTKRALNEGNLIVLNTPEDRGCPHEDCPLKSGVVAPLFVNGAVVGTIKLSRSEINSVSEIDIRLADGIANLLSVQIQLAEIDKQKKMREKAELKALQAQINPHFLFNTINIIMSFCRTAPDTARNLLGHLSTIMQRSFVNRKDFVTLQDELEGVKAYLEIAKSRFGSRLDVNIKIDDEVELVPVPVLSVQPLVENAIQHGLFPKLSQCMLSIKAFREADAVVICVSDNGIGITQEKMDTLCGSYSEGIGIANVYDRLRSIYGENYGLRIDSQVGMGTTAFILLPFDGEGVST